MGGGWWCCTLHFYHIVAKHVQGMIVYYLCSMYFCWKMWHPGSRNCGLARESSQNDVRIDDRDDHEFHGL